MGRLAPAILGECYSELKLHSFELDLNTASMTAADQSQYNLSSSLRSPNVILPPSAHVIILNVT